MKLKIIKICTSRSWGGMEIHSVLTCEKLRARGHQVFPVCYPASRIYQRLAAGGFQPLSLRLRSYFHPLAIRKLAQFIRQVNADLIHADYSRDLWTIVPAMKFSQQIPLVLIKHIGTMKPKTDFLHSYIYQNVDFIIAISAVIRQNIINTHPVEPAKVGIIHHGVDFSRFQWSAEIRAKKRQELGLQPGDLLIGIIGRLQVAKGHLEFLQMARQIAPEFKNTKFMVIGEASRGEDSEAGRISKAFEEAQMHERLIVTGYRDDVPDLLAAMDIFVFPSYAEAFGLVLIEAMSMKLPVISSNCDGVLDIVVQNHTGLLVPPKDVKQLTQAVRQVVTDKKLRLTMGLNGFNRALEKFNEENMLDQIEDLYYRLLKITSNP